MWVRYGAGLRCYQHVSQLFTINNDNTYLIVALLLVRVMVLLWPSVMAVVELEGIEVVEESSADVVEEPFPFTTENWPE